MDRDSALATMKEVINDQLGIDTADVGENTDFAEDLGADSLDQLQLITAMEDIFDVAIPDEDFEKIHTVADALDVLESLKG